jgi:hypothetical protein
VPAEQAALAMEKLRGRFPRVAVVGEVQPEGKSRVTFR